MDPTILRDDMVDSLRHESKGVLASTALSEAMRTVPREAFVPEPSVAYEDRAHEFEGTTVLSPSMVAMLLETLDPNADDEILVVGIGVGYTAAVLAELVGAQRVHGIDINRRLVHDARRRLRRAGYAAVLVDHGDGADGLADYAPFDRILVEAAAMDPPRSLTEQLRSDGRLVMPTGTGHQFLGVYRGTTLIDRIGTVAFRPLLLADEQRNAIERNRMAREDHEFAIRQARSGPGWEHEWIEWE